jgi:hypothetical protein
MQVDSPPRGGTRKAGSGTRPSGELVAALVSLPLGKMPTMDEERATVPADCRTSPASKLPAADQPPGPRVAWPNLTSALDDKTSPLRRYLDARYPDLPAVRAQLQDQTSGPLLVPGHPEVPPGTAGAAFDYLVRFTVAPRHVPTHALAGFSGRRKKHTPTIRALIEEAHDAAAGGDRREMARACWAIALCTEVYRAGLRPGSPLLSPIRRDTLTVEALLGLATPAVLAQLRALDDLAHERLYPHLAAHNGMTVVGPEFDASVLCKADADLIVDKTLLDLKTSLGRANRRTGVRADGVKLVEMYQLLGYVLFDTSDRYRIGSVGIYSARYGHLLIWPLSTLMTDAACDANLDLAAERAAVWHLLRNQNPSALP